MLPRQSAVLRTRAPWIIAGISRSDNKLLRSDMAGTSGTGGMPTGWSGGAATALTYSAQGKGFEFGIPYVDVRISGTAQAGSDSPNIYFDATGDVAGAQNDVWDIFVFLKLIGGSFTNLINMQIVSDSFSVGPTYLGGDYAGATINSVVSGAGNRPLPKSLFTQRYTISTALTTIVHPYLVLAATPSSAVDATFRIGYPMARKN